MVITKEARKASVGKIIETYQKKNYPNFVNNDAKSICFVKLISNIFLYYSSKPDISFTQLLLAYYLVHFSHKTKNEENKQKFLKSFDITLLSVIEDYSNYYSVLKSIWLITEEKANGNEEFLNKCSIIRNLIAYELNSNLNSFILKKEIDFPIYKKN